MKNAYIKIAAKTQPLTLAAAREIAAAHGLPKSRGREILDAAAHLRTLSKRARADRIDRRLGHTDVEPRGVSQTLRRIEHRRSERGRDAVRLPGGSPAARLDALRRTEIVRVFNRLYRQPAHGSISVQFGDTPAVTQTESLDWNLYAKSTRYPARVVTTTITAPRDWRVSVQREEIAVVDGLMTLAAARIDAGEVEAWVATWIEQGRGTSVRVVSGYIARVNGATHHADTLEKAIAGARRKFRAISDQRAAEDAEAFAKRVRGYGAVIVTLNDVVAVGACDPGIRNWCAAVGLDYDAGEATVAQILDGLIIRPRIEARLAVLHAIRRSRKTVAA